MARTQLLKCLDEERSNPLKPFHLIIDRIKWWRFKRKIRWLNDE